MEDNILTIEEVAKYLRVSDRTVYDWAQKGEIPAGKIGTVWRFKKSEVENWVCTGDLGNYQINPGNGIAGRSITHQFRRSCKGCWC